MSNINNTSWSSESGNLSGFGYGIGISIGILLLVTSIILVLYVFMSKRLSTSTTEVNNGVVGHVDVQVEEAIDIIEATILSYPKLLYCEARLHKSDHVTATCCSICLADYKDSDVLRLLPDCRHLFHLNCIDPWLRIHPTCPLCRTSPIPTPPLAPFSTTRDSDS